MVPYGNYTRVLYTYGVHTDTNKCYMYWPLTDSEALKQHTEYQVSKLEEHAMN